jgi:hypothetical protein
LRSPSGAHCWLGAGRARDWRRREHLCADAVVLRWPPTWRRSRRCRSWRADRSSCSAPDPARRGVSTNLDRRLVGTTAIGLITNIALNILFIPRLGITGAAWATVIAEAVTVTLLYVQVHRRLAAAGRAT